MMQEEWRAIPEVPWYYEASNLGRIRSLARVDRRGWRRKTRIMTFSNAEITLTYEEGDSHCHPVAALILLAFIGPPPQGSYLARHLNDDRSDNKLSNLAWGNDADNHEDAKRNGANFVSYGHLRKPHSEATKKLLSLLGKGRPTGRKMTLEHKAAIWAGFRKKFPAKLAVLCNCGCGGLAAPGKSFIHGHSGRIRFKDIARSRIGKPRQW